MAWTAMISRQEGKQYECEMCLDYGGIMDDESHNPNDNYLPYTMICDCQLPKFDE